MVFCTITIIPYLVFTIFWYSTQKKILFLPETSPLRGYLNTDLSGLNMCNSGMLGKQNLGDAGHGASLYKPLKVNNELSLHPIKYTNMKVAQEIATHW